MITFLSSPKPFNGYIGTIQRNAIRSWRAVHPDAEVIIYGDGEGVSEACRELKVLHVPDVPCTPTGIPYFNGIVEHARSKARHDIQCFLNCDVLVCKNMITAVQSVDLRRYLIVGQRIDLAGGVTMDMSGNWKSELRQLAAEGKACLHPPSGMDFFVFLRGLWEGLPPLIIGRGGYDGALLAFCLRNNIPLVNATLAFPILHQFHDYGHVSGGAYVAHRGEDAQANMMLHNIRHSIPSSSDAHWMLVGNEVVKNKLQADHLRRIELALRYRLKLALPALVVRMVWRLAVASKLYKIKSIRLEDILETAAILVMTLIVGGVSWS